jgi:hypothetical protein
MFRLFKRDREVKNMFPLIFPYSEINYISVRPLCRYEMGYNKRLKKNKSVKAHRKILYKRKG